MNLPQVVFGTSGLGNLYVVLSDEVKKDIVGQYLNEGKNNSPGLLDTAGKYGAGLALESLGKCLHELGVQPDKVLISNKLGWLRVPLTTPEPTFEPGVWKDLKYDAVQKISYDGILECYEQGNQLLGNYEARLVSVHDPDEYLAGAENEADEQKRYEDILAAYAALNELKQAGKVDAIGVGAKDWKSIARIDQDVKLDWVMIANSMTVHSHPKELIDFMKKLQQQGTHIINSAVFNAGFLTGGDYYNYRLIDAEGEEGKAMYGWRQKFYDTCAAFNVSPAAVCIRFGAMAPGVNSVALSTTNPKRVSSNIALADSVIPNGLWQKLYNEGLISKDGFEMTVNQGKSESQPG